MKRFVLLGKGELLNIQDTLNKELVSWMSRWTASRCGKLELCYLNDEKGEFESAFGGSSILKSDVVSIEDFNWAEFVFEQHLGLCPKDGNFETVIEHLRREFVENALGLKLNYSVSALTSTSVKDQICILVDFDELGKLAFYHRYEDLLRDLKKRETFRSATKLFSLFEAIKNIEIKADVKIDLGYLAFSDLIALKKGKVLKFNKRVVNDFQVAVDGSKVFSVNLGKIKQEKAVVIRGLI